MMMGMNIRCTEDEFLGWVLGQETPPPGLFPPRKMTISVAYTAMAREERGWRQLIPPQATPEDACQALADLIVLESSEPGGVPEDAQEIVQAVRLLREERAYEVNIGDRLHRIVTVELVIGMRPEGPPPPQPEDQPREFAKWPWHPSRLPTAPPGDAEHE